MDFRDSRASSAFIDPEALPLVVVVSAMIAVAGIGFCLYLNICIIPRLRISIWSRVRRGAATVFFTAFILGFSEIPFVFDELDRRHTRIADCLIDIETAFGWLCVASIVTIIGAFASQMGMNIAKGILKRRR